jgi:2'-hydroxyisoflavone reductase
VLAPGKPERQIQFVDARDLAGWIIRMAEARRAGTYNATGPDYVLTMGRFLEECRAATASAAGIVWADESFLLDAGVQPWGDLPLWLNEDNQELRYFLSVSNEKAVEAGLTFRPLGETIRDTLDWDATRPADLERAAGLTRQRELQLLQDWKAKSK